jgi:hypothetical protein
MAFGTSRTRSRGVWLWQPGDAHYVGIPTGPQYESPEGYRSFGSRSVVVAGSAVSGAEDYLHGNFMHLGCGRENRRG